MRSLISVAAAVTLLGALFGACGRDGHRGNGDDNYFSAFRTFSCTEWRYEDTLKLRVDTLLDSVATGPLMLSLRHTNGFQWSNLWIELSRRVDSVVIADTFNIPLADVAGNWYGNGTGPSRQLTHPLYEQCTLRIGDTLRVRHIMRVDTLEDIEQIGIVFNGE